MNNTDAIINILNDLTIVKKNDSKLNINTLTVDKAKASVPVDSKITLNGDITFANLVKFDTSVLPTLSGHMNIIHIGSVNNPKKAFPINFKSNTNAYQSNQYRVLLNSIVKNNSNNMIMYRGTHIKETDFVLQEKDDTPKILVFDTVTANNINISTNCPVIIISINSDIIINYKYSTTVEKFEDIPSYTNGPRLRIDDSSFSQRRKNDGMSLSTILLILGIIAIIYFVYQKCNKGNNVSNL